MKRAWLVEMTTARVCVFLVFSATINDTPLRCQREKLLLLLSNHYFYTIVNYGAFQATRNS